MFRVISLLLIGLVWAAPASGQVSFEVLGGRALGMGGAFVAVADDATAFHWNPAGMTKGSPASMTVGWDKLQFGNPKAPVTPGQAQDSNALTSVSTWPLGFSYGYFTGAQVVAVDAEGNSAVRALRVHHLGATFAQTIVKGLVVGTTVKYLSGQSSIDVSSAYSGGEVLKEGLDRRVDGDGAFDLDVGVMGEVGPIRAGLTMKNLLEPTFVGDGGFETQLKRRFRLGVAALLAAGLTLAFDVDLDTEDPLVRRNYAVGGEVHLGSSVALRSGVRWSRDGDKRPIASLGGSLRIRTGFWLDGYAIYSRYDDRGWGIAMRIGS
jgi:hypothetical protein